MIATLLIPMLVSICVSSSVKFCEQKFFNYMNRNLTGNQFNFYRDVNHSYTHHWIVDYNPIYDSFSVNDSKYELDYNLIAKSYAIDLSIENPNKTNSSMTLTRDDSGDWYWKEDKTHKTVISKTSNLSFVGVFWLKTKDDIYLVANDTNTGIQSVYHFNGSDKGLSGNKTVKDFFCHINTESKSKFWLWFALFVSIAVVIIATTIGAIIVCIRCKRKLISIATSDSYGPEFPSKTMQDELDSKKKHVKHTKDTKNLKTTPISTTEKAKPPKKVKKTP